MTLRQNDPSGNSGPVRPPNFQQAPPGVLSIVSYQKLTTGATLLSVRLNALAVVIHGVVLEPAAGFVRVVLPSKRVHFTNGGRGRRPICECGPEFRALVLKAFEQYRAEHADISSINPLG